MSEAPIIVTFEETQGILEHMPLNESVNFTLGCKPIKMLPPFNPKALEILNKLREKQ